MKNCFYIFDFLLVVLILFLIGLHFLLRGLLFHCIHTLIIFKTLTLESIFEYIRKKIYIRILILKFHPGMKCLNVFFSFLRPGMKFHPCLFDRDEFILGWNFISAKACKQWETFHHRQGWFHPGTSFNTL